MTDPLLVTEDLTKRFEALTAVDGVSLTIPAGGITAVIGPNGAGKTTLFNILTGKLRPDQGTIQFRGERIDGKQPHEIVRDGIARSYQITNFFPELTVLENARLAAQQRHTGFGLRDLLGHYSGLSEPIDAARSVLDSVDLKAEAESLASTLSHGQRRHLEVGIALASEPDLLLMDEPTAGMSPEETVEMTQLIESIAADTTLVLVEHDMEVVMNVSDRVAVMNQGQLLTVDTPAAVREDETVQRAYFSGGGGA
ncbi:MAG: ABC transporter ATP-binding protein [Halobacteriales archaeon]